MKFVNTRNAQKVVSCCDAIMQRGDGGLYVPSSLPILTGNDLKSLVQMDGEERVAKVLSILIDDLSYEETYAIVSKARDYDACDIVKVEDGLYMFEMWHSVSHTCKDVSLQLLPHLIKALRAKNGLSDKLLHASIVGRDLASVNAYNDVDGTVALALMPTKNVGELVHKLALQNEAENVCIASIKGDAVEVKTALKKVLCDEDFATTLNDKGIYLCNDEKNNILRVLTLTAEFISAYCDLVENGELEVGQKVNFALPAGNLTSVLACVYANSMGLPINKIVVASNANSAVCNLLCDGEYQVSRELYTTLSRGLDVRVSANLERLLFELENHNSSIVASHMQKLATDGGFELTSTDALDIFDAGWADEEDTKQTISTFFDLDDYIMDPNTAVVASVYNDYSCETDDETPTIIASLENPYMSSVEVLCALGSREKNEQRAIWKLQNLTALECAEDIAVEVECDDEKHLSTESIKALLLMQIDKLN